MVLRNAIPEERCRDEIRPVARILVARRGAEQLRDLTVDVLSGEVVLMAREGIRKGVVLESTRERQPARVAGVDIQVGEHLVHPAVLGVEHLCNLGVVERPQHVSRPLGEAHFDLERRSIPGVAIGVAQSGEGLVQRVPGRPEPIEIEGCRSDLPARERRKCLSPALQRAQIAVALFGLHRREIADEILRSVLEPPIAGYGVHQAHRREIVPGDVSGEVAPRTVPSAVRRRLSGKTGARPIKCQHPIRLELEQILDVGLLCALKRATGDPHLVQRHRVGDDAVAGAERYR